MSKLIYQIDPAHSSAQFKIRHLMIANVKGEFTKISGTVQFDPSDPSASLVEATIEVASVSTREPQRDTHLRSADFFDVEKYPAIAFRSTDIVPAGGSDFEVVGDLTIRGVTKQVALSAELSPEIKDPFGLLRRGAEAKTKISRKDFGVTYNAVLEAGGFAIGDDVEITIDVEMTRKPE